ncbi:hypothetical protein QOT17_016256 [Balamuthia mandrillaris]
MAWSAFFLVVLFSLWPAASSLPRNDASPDLLSWFDEKHFELRKRSIEEQTEDFVCALVNDVEEVSVRRGSYRTEVLQWQGFTVGTSGSLYASYLINVSMTIEHLRNSEVTAGNLSLRLSFDVFPLPLFGNDTFSLDSRMYLIVSVLELSEHLLFLQKAIFDHLVADLHFSGLTAMFEVIEEPVRNLITRLPRVTITNAAPYDNVPRGLASIIKALGKGNFYGCIWVAWLFSHSNRYQVWVLDNENGDSGEEAVMALAEEWNAGGELFKQNDYVSISSFEVSNSFYADGDESGSAGTLEVVWW